MTDTSHVATAPVVSVVIPTFNRADDLVRCFASLEAQTFSSFEVLLCDDGSTDHTAAVVTQAALHLTVHHLVLPHAGLPAAARNAGLRMAAGRYVAFLDSDDWWLPEKLARSVAALEAGADLVFHDLLRVPTTRPWLRNQRVKSRRLRHPVRASLLRRGNAIPNSSVVMRRALLDEVGLMSEDPAVRAEDFDMWLRVAERTDRFVRIRGAWGAYWMGGGNITSAGRSLDMLDEMRRRYLGDVRRLPTWYHFGVGWALFRTGQRRRARHHLVRALGTHGSPRLQRERFKALAMLCLSIANPSPRK